MDHRTNRTVYLRMVGQIVLKSLNRLKYPVGIDKADFSKTSLQEFQDLRIPQRRELKREVAEHPCGNAEDNCHKCQSAKTIKRDFPHRRGQI